MRYILLFLVFGSGTMVCGVSLIEYQTWFSLMIPVVVTSGVCLQILNHGKHEQEMIDEWEQDFIQDVERERKFPLVNKNVNSIWEKI